MFWFVFYLLTKNIISLTKYLVIKTFTHLYVKQCVLNLVEWLPKCYEKCLDKY